MSWVFVSEKNVCIISVFLTNNVYIYLVRNSMTRFIVVCVAVCLYCVCLYVCPYIYLSVN